MLRRHWSGPLMAYPDSPDRGEAGQETLTFEIHFESGGRELPVQQRVRREPATMKDASEAGQHSGRPASLYAESYCTAACCLCAPKAPTKLTTSSVE